MSEAGTLLSGRCEPVYPCRPRSAPYGTVPVPVGFHNQILTWQGFLAWSPGYVGQPYGRDLIEEADASRFHIWHRLVRDSGDRTWEAA